MGGSLVIAAMLLGSTLSAQQASHRFFGTSATYVSPGPGLGFPGLTSGSPIPFSVSGPPRLGTTFTVTTSPGAWGFWASNDILLGISNTQWGCVALPSPIGSAYQQYGTTTFTGQLYTSIEASMCCNNGTFNKAIPNVPVLAGVSFYQQILLCAGWYSGRVSSAS